MEILAQQPSSVTEPSPWVSRFAPLITPGGRVLDLACGNGRHALWLAERGFRIEAVDRDESALAKLADHPNIQCRQADLEGGPWPYYAEVFDAVVVTNYLWRPLLPSLLKVLDYDGVLIYETFMVGNERFGKPSNPAFLLRADELLNLVRGRLRIVAFEQGEIDAPRPAVVQRLVAIRAAEGRLPAR